MNDNDIQISTEINPVVIEEYRPIEILRGHSSPETAYEVEDYPYGFRLRCKIRYWLEHKRAHGHRLVSQTTNPKKPGVVWNKPKAGVYSPGLVVMYKAQNGHVMHAVVASPYSIGAKAVFLPLLNEEERKHAAALEVLSRKLSPISWASRDEAAKEKSVSQ